jgi:hypothetical protein
MTFSTEHSLLRDRVFIGFLKVGLCDMCWISLLISLQAGDGVFSVETDGDIVLVDLNTRTNRTLVSHVDVKDVSHLMSSIKSRRALILEIPRNTIMKYLGAIGNYRVTCRISC